MKNIILISFSLMSISATGQTFIGGAFRGDSLLKKYEDFQNKDSSFSIICWEFLDDFNKINIFRNDTLVVSAIYAGDSKQLPYLIRIGDSVLLLKNGVITKIYEAAIKNIKKTEIIGPHRGNFEFERKEQVY